MNLAGKEFKGSLKDKQLPIADAFNDAIKDKFEEELSQFRMVKQFGLYVGNKIKVRKHSKLFIKVSYESGKNN